MVQGLGPLPGVFTGWGSDQRIDARFREIERVPFGAFLDSAMGPNSALDEQAVPWQLDKPLGAQSFRASHIPIHGQPVDFNQALPVPLPARKTFYR